MHHLSQRWFDLCNAILTLMHEAFHVCLLLVCNAVRFSVKMSPQLWITVDFGHACGQKWDFSCLTVFFWSGAVMSSLAKCLNFNNSSCLFFHFCITEPVAFLTEIHMAEGFPHPNTSLSYWQLRKLDKCKCLNVWIIFFWWKFCRK